MLLPSILRFSVCNFTFFFFNDTATTEIYTLSLHDALPISPEFPNGLANSSGELGRNLMDHTMGGGASGTLLGDRKSTRLNSSHGYISYAVFCLKKKKKTQRFLISKNQTAHSGPCAY